MRAGARESLSAWFVELLRWSSERGAPVTKKNECKERVRARGSERELSSERGAPVTKQTNSRNKRTAPWAKTKTKFQLDHELETAPPHEGMFAQEAAIILFRDTES